MSKQTTINIEQVLKGQVSVESIYKLSPKYLDWIANNAFNFLQENKKEEALLLANKVVKVYPKHATALYLQGIIYLENHQITKSEKIFRKLLNFKHLKKNISLLPRKGCISILATINAYYMIVANEAGQHDKVHKIFQAIYNKYSKDRGTLTQDERDLKNIENCFKRMNTVLNYPQGDTALTQILMIDLRKLLWDEKAPNGKALLRRCGLNILLPSINDCKLSKFPKNSKPIFFVPMGNQPLTAKPDILYSVEDWLMQPIIFIGKEYSIKDIIKLLADVDGAHSDTQERIEKNHSLEKSGNIILFKNKQISYELIYKISAFLVTWLAEYRELVEKFPVLEKYKGKYMKDHFGFGLISKYGNQTGAHTIITR